MDSEPVARFFDEVWNRGALDRADALMAPGFVAHAENGVLRGPEAVKAMVAEWRTAFPDLRYTVDEWGEEGESIATRWHCDGTHLGDFAAVPPTGQSIRCHGVTLWRVSEGRIVEAWAADNAVEALGPQLEQSIVDSR